MFRTPVRLKDPPKALGPLPCFRTLSPKFWGLCSFLGSSPVLESPPDFWGPPRSLYPPTLRDPPLPKRFHPYVNFKSPLLKFHGPPWIFGDSSSPKFWGAPHHAQVPPVSVLADQVPEAPQGPPGVATDPHADVRRGRFALAWGGRKKKGFWGESLRIWGSPKGWGAPMEGGDAPT